MLTEQAGRAPAQHSSWKLPQGACLRPPHPGAVQRRMRRNFMASPKLPSSGCGPLPALPRILEALEPRVLMTAYTAETLSEHFHLPEVMYELAAPNSTEIGRAHV